MTRLEIIETLLIGTKNLSKEVARQIVETLVLEEPEAVIPRENLKPIIKALHADGQSVKDVDLKDFFTRVLQEDLSLKNIQVGLTRYELIVTLKPKDKMRP